MLSTLSSVSRNEGNGDMKSKLAEVSTSWFESGWCENAFPPTVP